ncbi:nucleoside hydrolase [Actinoallomurus bryophytorum]|uniref:Inosine-uridine nucleoside N-ribohydrolase n=1 Tax=Actinoallomurus bryophytorum TaxID=1490222 RepID=A0A543CM69_9ACTN|nr:nucleoside hydrolase [Actinoallomurus bryophytorum]TQL98189.1 inosine-uridine nucleoside N-ribohydrolase [Actinoallomurus bryophytorum]
MKTRILLDCDTGIDDALTLLYLASLVRSGEVDLVAVGTVHGNVAPEIGALNTLRVLERAGLHDVPVAVGAARPMAQEVAYAHDWHGTDGLGETGLPEPSGRPGDISAPEQIIRLARAHPGELSLLAVGPLTNLAIALLLEPALPGMFREVVVMGGAFEYGGNMTSHAEANVWHDPEAAELVFAAGWPVTLVPLDATHPTALDGEWLDRLAAAEGDVARFAARILEFYVTAYERSLGVRGAVIHDALAAMLTVDPSLGEYAERPVRVELRGDRTRGATLWDRRLYADEGGRPPVKVVVRTDVEAFRERLLASLL